MDEQKPLKPDTGITAKDEQKKANDEGPPAPEEVADAEMDAGSWLKQNWLMLAIVTGGLIYLYRQFGLDGLVAIGKVALGLSLLIFVHELGHYLAAKWCGVYVQVFSIGFGPAVPGCHFKWGETYYKLAIFPFGGYVQMLGQVDVHEESDGTEDDPRSYKNKTVLQRMFIISAGVIMNVLLAIVCFVAVFQGPGKERRASVVAMVDSNSPAFTKGIPNGAVIDRIGNVDDPHFKDLMIAVISHYNSELEVTYHKPKDSGKTTIKLIPRKDSSDDRPLIGISPSFVPILEEKRFLATEFKIPAWPNSAATKAEPPFEFEDKIIAVTDPNTGKVTPLDIDPRKAEGDQLDYFDLARRMQLLAGKEMVFKVQRKENGQIVEKEIKVPPEYHNTLGLVMAMGEITAKRENSPAATAGVQKTKMGQGKGNKELEGDYIERVEVVEPDGSITRFTAELGKIAAPPGGKKVKEVLLDPLRLPDLLRAWAKRLAKKEIPAEKWTVTLFVKRQNPPPTGGGNPQFDTKELKLTWDKDWEFDRVEPFSEESPLAIPELGLGYQIKTQVIWADPKNLTGKTDDLQPIKDWVKEIKIGSFLDDDDTFAKKPWKKVEEHQWAFFGTMLSQSSKVGKISLKINRDQKEEVIITLEPKKDTDWPLAQRGLILAQDKRLQKATDFFDAVALGLRDTYNTTMELFTGLRSMATGGVSVEKSLGGPVMIATITYQYASIDFWEFVFLLGMISINLAVINFLPIPVLDGGHMVFLLYELVRGKPASEGVRVGATYAGLLFILCLFVFVLYLDITRLFFRSG